MVTDLPLFALEIYEHSEGFGAKILYDENSNRALLEEGLSLDYVIAEIVVGFLVVYCKERSIDLNRILTEVITRNQMYSALTDEE